MLPLTIDSFLRQSLDPAGYEIIVVDNKSTDGTALIAKGYAERHPKRVRYLLEGRQGVHFARNSGAKAARGRILYNTDDDMIADPALLAEILKVFEFDNAIASVTGRVVPQWETEPPAWVKQLMYNAWLSLHDPPEEFIISKRDFGVFSCHQAILREAFFKSGGFNPENTAGEWIGDGETGLNIKIKEHGYKFGFNGASVIHHMIPPQRMTQAYFNRRLTNQGSCDSYTAYVQHRFSNRGLVRQIVTHAARAAYAAVKCAINFGRRSARWRLNRAYVSYFLSRIRYDLKLMYSEPWRDLVLRYDWLSE